MKTPKIRSYWHEKTNKGTVNSGESLVKQCFKNECDINNILSRYQRTGIIDHVKQNPGRYADLTGVSDFTDAMNTVAEVSNVFSTLPAKLRKELNHDPQNLIDYLENPANRPQLEALGLLEPMPPKPASEAVSPPAGDTPPPAGETTTETAN